VDGLTPVLGTPLTKDVVEAGPERDTTASDFVDEPTEWLKRKVREDVVTSQVRYGRLPFDTVMTASF
jgi:hypothetical protein